jgi:hypothetical protein
MNKKRILYSLPVSSLEFTTEAYLDSSGAMSAIRFVYKAEGKEVYSGLSFNQVYALRQRSERYCTVWHIEDTYDTLVEVEDSSWVKELREDMSEHYRKDWRPHHYMIYLDSVGCFEFLAESWVSL